MVVVPDWVGVWSPGLQAIGGIVELVGAAILAYEWWKGTREAIQKYKSDRDAKMEAWVRPSLPEQEDLDAPFEKALSDIKISTKYLFQHRALYKIGFALIVVGVVLQVAANGIAWAGARGFFS